MLDIELMCNGEGVHRKPTHIENSLFATSMRQLAQSRTLFSKALGFRLDRCHSGIMRGFKPLISASFGNFFAGPVHFGVLLLIYGDGFSAG